MKTLGNTPRPRPGMATFLLGVTGLLGLLPWQVTARAASPTSLTDRQLAIVTMPRPKPTGVRTTGRSLPHRDPGAISTTLPMNTADARKPDDLGLSHDPFPRLLSYRSVRQELALTPEQQKRLQPVMAEWEDAVGRMHYTYRGLRRARRADAEIRRRLPEVLTTEQLRRLSQIDRQHRPPSALFWDDVAQELDLTAAQRDQIRGILRDYEQGIARLATEVERLQGQSPEIAPGHWGQGQTWRSYEIPAASTPGFVQAGEEAYTKAVAVLTDTQRARWKELFGARFFIRELPFTRMMKLPGPS